MTLPVSRRGLIATTSGVALIPVLNACGAGQGAETVGPVALAKGTQLMAIADVPVGGCAVNADLKVVVSQPLEGEFKAFSAVCTHQGCLVVSSSEGDIPCNCHGSRFSLTDGAVLAAPATQALPVVEIGIVDGVVTTV